MLCVVGLATAACREGFGFIIVTVLLRLGFSFLGLLGS